MDDIPSQRSGRKQSEGQRQDGGSGKDETSTATTYTGHKLEKLATIKLPKAREIALKERPGTITDFELEREKGGSGLRYSFDIKTDNVRYEVGVDAKSGKILENSKDGPHPD